MTITKRTIKGTALTYAEMDENIRDLYEDTTIDRVLENGNTTTRNITTTGTIAAGEINVSLTQGNVKIQNLNVVGSVNSDAGIIFDGAGSIKSVIFTEVNGQILSYGINVAQIDDLYDSARAGGIFRLDTRTGAGGSGNANCFVVKSRAPSVLTESNALIVTLDTRNLHFDSGFGSAGIAFGCRAWVNFNGTGTVAIRGSGNVTSITDNGTGDYTINFTTAMPDANYSYSHAYSDEVNVQHTVGFLDTTSAGSLRVKHFNTANSGNTSDKSFVFIAVFR